jgi:hypothetical protein
MKSAEKSGVVLRRAFEIGFEGGATGREFLARHRPIPFLPCPCSLCNHTNCIEIVNDWFSVSQEDADL